MSGMRDAAGAWLAVRNGHVATLTTRLVSRALSIDQPTIFLENMPMTTQRLTLPIFSWGAL